MSEVKAQTGGASLESAPVLTEHARNSRLGRQLLGHIVFLVLFSIVTIVPMNDPHYETFTLNMRRIFFHEASILQIQNATSTGPRFTDVNSVGFLWKWIRGPFLSTVYAQDWYSGSSWDDEDQGSIAGSNIVVGTVNLRQKRVRSGTCIIPEEFMGANDLDDCVSDFSPATEDKEVFGPFFTEPEWATAFAYAPNWHEFHGSLRSYTPGAFAIELPAARCMQGTVQVSCMTKAFHMLMDLESTGWIDHRTRVVVAEVSVYNPPLNRLALIQAVFELPSSGGIVPYAHVWTSTYKRYVTTNDYALLGFELALILLVVFDILEKVVFYRLYKGESKRDRKWDILDSVFYAAFIVAIACRISAHNFLAGLNLDASLAVQSHLNGAMFWNGVSDSATGFAAWILWLRTFKFLQEFSLSRPILETLTNAAAPLTGVCVVGLCILLAFAHVGLVSFGSQIYDFRTMGNAIVSCFTFIFAGMDYEEFRVAGAFMGPVYYFIFKLFVVLIYVRFFVVVVIDAYRQVMDQTRGRWSFSFPPLKALADDLSRWWYEDKQGSLESMGGKGALAEKHRTSMRNVMAANDASAVSEHPLTHLDAREMYKKLQEQIDGLENHVDTRVDMVEKMFLTTVAPLIETLDVLVRQQTDNAALSAVRTANK